MVHGARRWDRLCSRNSDAGVYIFRPLLCYQRSTVARVISHRGATAGFTPFLSAVTRDKGDCAPLDRSLVTLMAQGSLIETIGVKRTLEITNIRSQLSCWCGEGKKEHLSRSISCASNLTWQKARTLRKALHIWPWKRATSWCTPINQIHSEVHASNKDNRKYTIIYNGPMWFYSYLRVVGVTNEIIIIIIIMKCVHLVLASRVLLCATAPVSSILDSTMEGE